MATGAGCGGSGLGLGAGCGGRDGGGGGGAAWTTVVPSRSSTERAPGEEASGAPRCIGSVNNVVTASVSTTPLTSGTSFGLMEMPPLADTHP